MYLLKVSVSAHSLYLSSNFSTFLYFFAMCYSLFIDEDVDGNFALSVDCASQPLSQVSQMKWETFYVYLCN